MARAPSEYSYEALIKEVARFAEKVDQVDRRVDELRADAREARDAALSTKAKVEQQNFPQQLTQLAGEFKAEVTALRSDLVNANTLLKREMKDGMAAGALATEELTVRVVSLEKIRERQVGAVGLLGFLAKHFPALVAALAAAAATLGLERLAGK